MLRFRAFRNGDPPALASLWNRALPDRGVVRPLTAHEFDALVIGRIVFDREGLIVAEDDGQVVGFAHASFGPEAPLGPSHRLDRSMGTVAMLVVEPGRDDPSPASGLIEAAENYLRSRGAKVFYAGPQFELSSFYLGIYNGSEGSGLLESHESFRRAANIAGYQLAARTISLEAVLGDCDPRDPRSAMVRRQVRVETSEDAKPAGWWEALALGHAEITRFRVFAKSDDREVARASTWDMAAFLRTDGRSRSGLFGLEVAEGERRKGLGRFLVGEVFRHARSQWGEVVSVQTFATNLPALGLYKSCGFQPTDDSSLLRKPGP